MSHCWFKCTYSLMLCTPLNVHLVYVNGYHFVSCENLFVTVLIVKQFIVLSETVVFLTYRTILSAPYEKIWETGLAVPQIARRSATERKSSYVPSLALQNET